MTFDRLDGTIGLDGHARVVVVVGERGLGTRTPRTAGSATLPWTAMPGRNTLARIRQQHLDMKSVDPGLIWFSTPMTVPVKLRPPHVGAQRSSPARRLDDPAIWTLEPRSTA